MALQYSSPEAKRRHIAAEHGDLPMTRESLEQQPRSLATDAEPTARGQDIKVEQDMP